jgi:hypothetical protein
VHQCSFIADKWLKKDTSDNREIGINAKGVNDKNK